MYFVCMRDSTQDTAGSDKNKNDEEEPMILAILDGDYGIMGHLDIWT